MLRSSVGFLSFFAAFASKHDLVAIFVVVSASALGGYLLGILTVILQLVLPSDLVAYRDAVVFLVVIVLFVVRPQGLVVAPWVRERV